MTAVWGVAALVALEVRHHGLAVLAALVLAACGWIAALFFTVNEASRALPAVSMSATVFLPFLVIYLAERLVGRDYAAGTHEHLATLPIARFVKPLVAYVVGAAVVLALALVLVGVTGAIASRIEGVPPLWLLQVFVQVALVALGWWGVAFALAFFGRWRWVLWWTGSLLIFALDSGWVYEPVRTLTWLGPLAESIDRSRSAPPWSTMPVALLWALGGLVVGLVLAQVRQGTLPVRLYARADARARSALVVAAILAIGATHFLGEAAPVHDAWSLAPAVPSRTAVVRPLGGGELRELAVEVADRLDTLADEIGVARWPGVVLQASRATDGLPARPIPGASGVLAVDLRGDREAVLRGVLTDVFRRHAGGLAQDIAGLDEVVAGAALARWPQDRALAAIGAIPSHYAGSGGATEAAPEAPTPPGASADWPSYRQTRRVAGEAAAEALAAARIRALDPGHDTGAGLGPNATCLLRHALAPDRGSSLIASISARWAMRGDPAARVCGASRGPLVVPPDHSASPVPSVQLAVDEAGVYATVDPPGPEGAVLRYQSLDPLEIEPRWGSSWRVVDAAGRARVDLGLSASAPAVAELLIPDAAGFRSSGQGLLRPGVARGSEAP